MSKEIECRTFKVEFFDGPPVQYKKSKEEEYQWALSPSGDMLIYMRRLHPQFSAVISDDRICCYARGDWKRVIVEDETDES